MSQRVVTVVWGLSLTTEWRSEKENKQTKKYCVGLGKHLLEITQLKNPHKHVKSLWTFSSIYNPNSFVFVCLTVEVTSSNKQHKQVNNQGKIQSSECFGWSVGSFQATSRWSPPEISCCSETQCSEIQWSAQRSSGNGSKEGNQLRAQIFASSQMKKYLWRSWEYKPWLRTSGHSCQHMCSTEACLPLSPLYILYKPARSQKNRNMSRRFEVVLLKWKLSCLPSHQVLQRVAHQFLLQSFHQSHLNGLCLILRLAVGAEPLRQNWSILRRRRRASQIIYREQYTLTGSSKTQQATKSQASTLLLSPVLRMGPCRGPGPGRNCTGGRWPPAGRRSYRGRGTEPPPRTLPRPPDAGGLSSACSPGSTRWSPATEPERTHEEDSQRLLNIFQKG